VGLFFLKETRKPVVNDSSPLTATTVKKYGEEHGDVEQATDKTSSDDKQQPQQHKEEEVKPKPQWAILLLLKEKQLLLVIVLYMVLILHAFVFAEVFSFWAVSDAALGGLSFAASDVGTCMSLSGFILPVFSWYIYPWIARRSGPIRIFQVSILLTAPFTIITPGFSWFAESARVVMWVGIIGTLVMRNMIVTACFISMFSLVINSVPGNIMGAANGLAESAGSTMKAIGPISGGFIFYWSLTNGLRFPFNIWWSFILLTLMCIFDFVVSLKLSPELNTPKSQATPLLSE